MSTSLIEWKLILVKRFNGLLRVGDSRSRTFVPRLFEFQAFIGANLSIGDLLSGLGVTSFWIIHGFQKSGSTCLQNTVCRPSAMDAMLAWK